VYRNVFSDLGRDPKETPALGLVEHHQLSGSGSDQKDRLTQLGCILLQNLAREFDDRFAIQRPQTQRDQCGAGPIATALRAIDETAPAEGCEQPMGARFWQAQGSPDRGHTLGLRRSVEMEKDVDGLLYGGELIHAVPLGGSGCSEIVLESSKCSINRNKSLVYGTKLTSRDPPRNFIERWSEDWVCCRPSEHRLTERSSARARCCIQSGWARDPIFAPPLSAFDDDQQAAVVQGRAMRPDVARRPEQLSAPHAENRKVRVV